MKKSFITSGPVLQHHALKNGVALTFIATLFQCLCLFTRMPLVPFNMFEHRKKFENVFD